MSNETGLWIPVNRSHTVVPFSYQVDQYRDQVSKLALPNTIGFQIGNIARTLLLKKHSTSDLPSLRLRDNRPTLNLQTGENAYTYTDIKFSKRGEEARLRNGTYIESNIGKFFSDNSINDPDKVSRIIPEVDNSSTDTIILDSFENIVANLAINSFDSIMELFRKYAQDGYKVDKYGRTVIQGFEDQILKNKLFNATDLLIKNQDSVHVPFRDSDINIRKMPDTRKPKSLWHTVILEQSHLQEDIYGLDISKNYIDILTSTNSPVLHSEQIIVNFGTGYKIVKPKYPIYNLAATPQRVKYLIDKLSALPSQ